MNGLEEIKAINAGGALHKRARAYCQNNHGVGFTDACAKLTKGDEKLGRVRKSHSNAAKEGRK